MTPIPSLIEQGIPFVENHGSFYLEGYVQRYARRDIVDSIKKELLELEWLTKRTARHEYFMSLIPRTYSYAGSDEYNSREFSHFVNKFMRLLNRDLGTNFNVCFLNKYDDHLQHLGWHADDFPTMDPTEPIGVISFGAEREIWVKDQRGLPCLDCQPGQPGISKSVANMSEGEVARDGSPVCETCEGSAFVKGGDVPDDQKILLGDGSLFLMPPGYQDTHFHRIPKHSRPCGWRISLTFRSFKP